MTYEWIPGSRPGLPSDEHDASRVLSLRMKRTAHQQMNYFCIRNAHCLAELEYRET